MAELDALYTEAELANLRRFIASARANPIAHFKPRSYAMEFMRDRHTVTFASGGKKSGKSFHCAAKASVALTGVDTALHCPGVLDQFTEIRAANRLRNKPPFRVRHWVVDLERAGEQIIMPLYKAFIPYEMRDLSNGKDGYNSQRKVLKLKDGSYIQLMSYEMEDMKAESAEIELVVFDEPPKEKLYEGQYARIVDSGGWMIGAMTLDERRTSYPISWIDRRIRRRGDGPHVNWYTFDTDQNNLEISKEVGGTLGERIRTVFSEWSASISQDEYDVVIKGLGGWLTGLVYKEFDRNVHAAYDFLTPLDFAALVRAGYGEICCGLDYGLAHPTACSWLYRHTTSPLERVQLAESDVLMIAEYKHAQRNIDANIACIREMSSHLGPVHAYYADPNMWNRTNKGGPGVAADFIRAGCRLVESDNAESEGIERVKRLLAVPRGDTAKGWPRFRIVKGECPKAVDEFEGWSWKPESERAPSGGDRTMNEMNDLLDGIKYFANMRRAHLFGTARETEQTGDLGHNFDPQTGLPLDYLFTNAFGQGW